MLIFFFKMNDNMFISIISQFLPLARALSRVPNFVPRYFALTGRSLTEPVVYIYIYIYTAGSVYKRN